MTVNVKDNNDIRDSNDYEENFTNNDRDTNSDIYRLFGIKMFVAVPTI